MQANPVNAAQLLMEYLSKEQGEIAFGIVTSEFSNELKIQQVRLSEDKPATPSLAKGKTAVEKSLQPLPARNVPFSLSKVSTQPEKHTEKRMESMKRMISPSKAAKREPAKETGEEIYVANPALLEKTLADLKLPAEVRKACKSAEDGQCRITLKSLTTILDKTTGSGESPPGGRISARDLKNLLSSIVDSESNASILVQGLETDLEGIYDFEKFRKILDQVVQQVEESKTGKPTVLQQMVPETDSNGAVAKVVAVGSDAMPQQPQSLISTLVPSFSSTESSKENAQESSIPVDQQIRNAINEEAIPAGATAPGDSVPANATALEAQSAAESMPKAEAEAEAGSEPLHSETGQSGRQGKTPIVQLKETADKQALNIPRGGITAEGAQPSTSPTVSNSQAAGVARVAVTEMSKADTKELSGAVKENATSGMNTEYSEQISKSSTESIENSLSQDADNPDSQSNQNLKKESFAFSQSGRDGSGTKSSDFSRHALNSIASHLPGASTSQMEPYLVEGRLSFQHASWVQDLAQKLQELMQQKRMEHLTLELEPNELGRMTLRIGMKQEEVTAWISTEKEQVRELLLKNSPHLRQHLQDQGFTLGQFLVDVRDQKSDIFSDQANRQLPEKNSRASTAQGKGNGAVSRTNNSIYIERQHQGTISLFA